jgi:peptidoglycan/LPS O-acetylase OafA/YrhL
MTFERYKARKRIKELDGLRAIAVLLVVTVHMHDKLWPRLNGALGVVIFFVLSGYLITMLALREEEARGRLDFSAFYIRRTFRIFPLYYVVLAAYAVVILVLRVSSGTVGVFVHSIPYYVFYLQEIVYFRSYSTFPLGHSWTLGIEEKFYLLWPLIAFGALTFAKGLRRIATVVIIVILVLCPALFTSIRWYQLQNYAYILMGALLAVVLEDRAGFAFMHRLRDVGLAFVLPVLTALQFSRLQADPRLYARTAYALVVMFLLGILVITEGRIQRFLSTPLLGFIGELSYGIYLVHVLCLNVAEKAFPPGKGLGVPAYVLTCLISIAVAYVLNRLVEKPMIHVGRMLNLRLQRRRSLGTAQTRGELTLQAPERQTQ